MTGAHALHGGFQDFWNPRRARAMALRALAAQSGHGGHRGGPHGHRGGPPGGPFGPGFGPFGPGGPGGPGGFGPPFGRRRRMRRGDVRAALLVLLAEQPYNGYGLMQEIEQRSEGAWRPSPGAVYPALSQLEDEGLVRSTESDGRKQYELTDEGRTHVEEHREELGEPWAKFGQEAETPRGELKGLIWQLGAATVQVATAGTDAQVERARQVLVDARRTLYRILADEPEEGGEQ